MSAPVSSGDTTITADTEIPLSGGKWYIVTRNGGKIQYRVAGGGFEDYPDQTPGASILTPASGKIRIVMDGDASVTYDYRQEK